MNDLEAIRQYRELLDDLEHCLPGTWPVLRDKLHLDGDRVIYRPDGDEAAWLVKHRWAMIRRHCKQFGFEVVWE